MYILVKLDKRAYTTDTILYYASPNRNALEEILLSLYDELTEANWDKKLIDGYLYTFDIIFVPLIF